ncbi:MAG: DUF481 domain-containing protein [Bacteroidota bacterium]
MHKKILIAFLFIVFIDHQAICGPDSLLFKNGNILVGEIQGMQKGVLEIDVSYGDSNFLIKWVEVDEIYTETQFIISINKEIYQGRMISIDGDSIKIFNAENPLIETTLREIVFMRPIKDRFADRFSASIELGFNATRAQNLRQFSNRTTIGYRTKRWITDANYSSLRSFQDDIEDIIRQDGQLNFRFLMNRSWYVIASYSILSNSEQKLDLRMNTQLGLGNFLYSSNTSYWSLKVGVNNNNENFSSEQSNQNSWEGFISMELNLYDIGDLQLLVEYIGYSGLNDFSRFRFDTNIDLKYELPFDLFIRTGLSLNFDNQPALDGSQTAYVLRTGLGWEW